MKKTTYFIIGIFLVLIYSCGQETIENKYELPEPALVISNPIPCIDEEITIYYQTNTSASPTWRLDGEEISTEAVVNLTFTENGKHNIVLRLTDGNGGEVSVSQSVEVLGHSLSSTMKKLVKTPSEIWICGHRANTYEGMTSDNIPENSLEAILKSIEKGVEMVEIDILTTYDGHFVLMHDATINRTTNGAGYVKSKTLAELRALKLKSNTGVLTDCTIPTLEEALLVGRGKVFYNLDIAGKPNDVEKMTQLVDSLHMLDRAVFYTGGNREMIETILKTNKKAIIFPWVSTASEINYYSSNNRINLIQMNYKSATASNIISYGRENQMVSFSNSLGDADKAILKNDFREIEKMKSMQLQIIQTDYAEILKDYLSN